MIQIPLVCDLHISSGEVPRLEFQDRKEFEHFIAYLQRQDEIIRGKRKQRLEYFSDGVYFDGIPLDLRGKMLSILKAFEFVERISKIDLICKVWGNSLINDSTFWATIWHFNKKLKDKDIFVYYDSGYYVIHRPD